MALLRRCKSKGLVEVSDGDLNTLANRETLSPSWLDKVPKNGVEHCESVE